MTASWKVIFAFLGVFVAGTVFGGLFVVRSANRKIEEQQQPAVVTTAPVAPAPAPTQAQARPPQAARPANNAANNRTAAAVITPEILRRLALQLKLTDEQKEKVQPIIKRAAEDMNYLRVENFRATSRVLERMHGDIAAVLTDEQRMELEVLKRNIQDRMAKAEKERRDEARMRKELKGTADAASTTAPAATPTKTN